MKHVLDALSPVNRSVIIEVLTKRAPELLTALQGQTQPTVRQQEDVTDVLADELGENLGPGQEPTDRGKLLDNALGEFLIHWPADNLQE